LLISLFFNELVASATCAPSLFLLKTAAALLLFTFTRKLLATFPALYCIAFATRSDCRTFRFSFVNCSLLSNSSYDFIKESKMPFPKDAEVEVEEEFDFLFTSSSREEEEEEEEEEDAAAAAALAELPPPSMTGSKTTASTSRPSLTKSSSLAFDRVVVVVLLSTPNCLFPTKNDDENDDEAKRERWKCARCSLFVLLSVPSASREEQEDEEDDVIPLRGFANAVEEMQNISRRERFALFFLTVKMMRAFNYEAIS